MKLRLVIVALFALLTGLEAKTLDVLFVGNSYTFVCGMPEMIRVMAEAKGHELSYSQQTPGGRTFQQHWEEGKAVEKIREGNFDAVVLQNQSFEPVIDAENMFKYGKMLATEVDKSGARKLYYMTMAYKGPVKWMKGDSEQARKGLELLPQMNDRLVKAYSLLGKETNGDIAPVGPAWKLAYESDPELKLHSGDNSHAAVEGAYLTALVIYSSLFGEEAVDMPGSFEVQARKKGKVQTLEVQISSETRKKLEAAARQACREFGGK